MNCKQCAHWDKCSKTNGKTRYYGATIAADNVEELCEWFIFMADVTTKSEIIKKFLENGKKKGYSLIHTEGLTEDLVIKFEMAKSAIAREIFEEIEEYFGMYNVPIFLTRNSFAKLKKKYTEGE